MHFFSQTASDGVVEKTFAVDGVPGVLWSPIGASDPAPLVLMGHPGGLHKKARGLVARAAHLVTVYGFHAASIDAPGHGDRERSAEDSEWVDRMQRARTVGEPLGVIVSEFNASIAARAVPEWRATLDALQTLPEIDPDSPVGFSGMTLATEIGFRLAAVEPRIGAAGLGAAFASEALLDVARSVTAPLQYLLPWDDPEIDRESGLALFDAIGSAEKSLHAFPGPHQTVPAYEAEDSARFLARHLVAK
ncbi:alpha/beta hydrolase [Diaminobutyricibacter sp. McL0608]|uniref:alpha/beta hydrolase n=1 Tax=Leifsonia sp. McL0608 TaxID=3143537 RepID=UPI0031F30A5C